MAHCESLKGHILRDYIMRDEQIGPELTAVAARMVRGLFAPGGRHISLRHDFGIRHLVRSFGFEHENSVLRFGNEVWLVLWSVGPTLVIDLKLALRRLEPF